MNKINEVLDAYEKKNVKLNIHLLDQDFVVIEGNKETLKFLGNLFLTLADSEDEDIQLSPHGAGRLFFSKKSPKGIYINKTKSN